MKEIDKLREIMTLLRDPEKGCPWDREQDFASIAPYTIEEAYEVADSIDRGDFGGLCGELGDLLLQVVFHAHMAKEAGYFTLEDVARSIVDKLIRRHPHVFAGQKVSSLESQRENWEAIKSMEQARDSARATGLLAPIALALPALARAAKLSQRAARVGFDWRQATEVEAKLLEELAEIRGAMGGPRARIEEEVGDLLFTAANLARHLDVDPEEALRRANQKFERRFQQVENAVRQSGRPWHQWTADELDALWQHAKRAV